jgi:hypothetical protein
MNTFLLTRLKIGLALAIVVLASGCALTIPVQKRIDGYTKEVKDNSPQGRHEEKHQPQPAYIPLLFVTVPVDVVTLPIQLPFVLCMWKFYGVQFCDAGEHDSPALNSLTMRSAEPAHRATVAIHASRGPGR